MTSVLSVRALLLLLLSLLRYDRYAQTLERSAKSWHDGITEALNQAQADGVTKSDLDLAKTDLKRDLDLAKRDLRNDLDLAKKDLKKIWTGQKGS